MFPEDCIQSVIGGKKWWEERDSPHLARGALVFAFAPHVDQIPYAFEPIGRKDPEAHSEAIVRVAPLSVDQPLRQAQLPVAAMPLNQGEVWAAYRAKKRPCLVLSCNTPGVDPALTKGMMKNATAPTCLVAPYYGVAQAGKRGGYQEEFVQRVRRSEYPQFMWDFLPIPGGEESILRLDHTQPIGTHYKAYKASGFGLCADAIEILDELLSWLIKGGVPKDSLIAMYRKEIEDVLGA
jgi:hypothetical protein